MEPLLAHHFFNSDLNLLILPPDFANGNLFEWRHCYLPPAWLVAHASWTENATNKVLKLRAIGEGHSTAQHSIVQPSIAQYRGARRLTCP